MKMTIKEYDTFILSDPSTLVEDREMELIVRDLTPPNIRYKYRSAYVSAMISNPNQNILTDSGSGWEEPTSGKTLVY
jgi:hypothetical protein